MRPRRNKEGEMEIPEHFHCKDCGGVVAPGDTILDQDDWICAGCFENKDIAAMPSEVRAEYFKSKGL